MIPNDVHITRRLLCTGELPIVEEDGLRGRCIKTNRIGRLKKVVNWENRLCVPQFEIFKTIRRHQISNECFDKFSKTRSVYQKEYEDCVDFLRKTDRVVNNACMEIESKIFGLCGKLASLGSKKIHIVYRQPMTIVFSDPYVDGNVAAAFVHVGIYSED